MCIFTVRVLAVLSYRATLLSALSHLNLKMSGSRSLMVLLLWQLSIWVQLVVWWLCHLWTSVLIIEESFHPLHCWHKNTRILTWSSHGEILLNFPDRNFCQISPLDLSPVFFLLQHFEKLKIVLLFFIAMAVSALLSNALFHLIPQALELNAPTSQKYDETMVIIFAGFYGFYVVGKLLDIGTYPENRTVRFIPFRFNIFWRFLNKTILYRFQAW